MNHTIIEAIEGKKQLEVTYNNTKRIVEPHAYGYDKNGKLKVRVFQVAEAAEHTGWRLFNEEAITDIAVLDTTFAGAQAGYQPGDKHLDTIIAEL